LEGPLIQKNKAEFRTEWIVRSCILGYLTIEKKTCRHTESGGAKKPKRKKKEKEKILPRRQGIIVKKRQKTKRIGSVST